MNMYAYFLGSGAVALLGLMAAFSFLSEDHKETLLGSDWDGLQPFVLGIVLIVAGFAFGGLDLMTGYLLKGLGLVFAAFGTLIVLPDGLTDKVLHPFMGVVYALAAIVAFVKTTLAITGTLAYNMHAFWVVAPAVAVATLFATLFVLAFTSESFRNRLEQEVGGGTRLIIAGIALMFLAPLGSLVIITAGLGALLTTLGVLIALDDDQVEWLLAKSKTIVYAIGAILAFVAARML